jgi:hypothetical protein
VFWGFFYLVADIGKFWLPGKIGILQVYIYSVFSVVPTKSGSHRDHTNGYICGLWVDFPHRVAELPRTGMCENKESSS